MDKKILIIDSNLQDQKNMKECLERAGCENVLFASNGEEGLVKYRAGNPDLVIIETVLSGANGFEVCRKIKDIIRAGSAQVNTKIIVMTGAIDAVDAVVARDAGADDYCAKTHDFSQLIKKVEENL